MKFGIVHLTDIHIVNLSGLNSKIEPLCKAILREFQALDDIVVIISGDIASTGDSKEFDNAEKFLSIVKQLIENGSTRSIRWIFVPGNHDCNFGRDNQLRKNCVTNLNYDSVGEDNSVIDSCLAVQEDFWTFYRKYRSLPDNKLFWTVQEEIKGEVIQFNCINTAWVSELREKPGKLFFPVKRFSNYKPSVSIEFGVWHHPYNWFNPSTPENNKKEFERFTEQVARTHFFGHEHETSSYLNQNIDSNRQVNLLGGKVFHLETQRNESGFQTVLVNTKEASGYVRTYQFKNGAYLPRDGWDIQLGDRISSAIIEPSPDFVKNLEEVNIPLTIETRKNLKLSDFYVFPDLEIYGNETRSFDNYFDSSRVLMDKRHSCIITGDSQIGKTSLLKMLCLRAFENGYAPVIIHGSKIKDLNVEKLLRREFALQYGKGDDRYEFFMQLQKSKKFLLIDDFHDSALNSKSAKEWFSTAQGMFGTVIATIDVANSILPTILTEFHEFQFLTIKPMGYKKRNELIEKYILLKENTLTSNEQEVYDNIRFSFDNVQSILGDRLLPAYPVFILSILQALEYKPLKQNETSFGYCYQTLLHYSLHKAGVKHDDIDSYFNFLAELAYHFIEYNYTFISDEDFFGFYVNYQTHFIIQGYETVLKCLRTAKILTFSNGECRFGYEYILYYLSAKKISDMLHTPSGREITQKLFQEVYVERNANILVFITHHSRDISFIETSVFSTMLAIENAPAITLEKTDPFYQEVSSFVEGIATEIIDFNRQPKEARMQMLEAQDKFENANENTQSLLSEIEEVKQKTIPFKTSFRSIEIVGQILKNRKGSLNKSQMEDMIRELYTTAFRTVGYLSDLLLKSKSQVIEIIQKEVADELNTLEIEKRINKFVQFTSFEACLGVFTKLIHAIGHKDLRQLYERVGDQMDTAAAKLVSFGINSYYGTIREEELIALADEFENNIVATRILKARVRSYVYNRKLDFKVKQRFATILKMDIVSAPSKKMLDAGA